MDFGIQIREVSAVLGEKFKRWLVEDLFGVFVLEHNQEYFFESRSGWSGECRCKRQTEKEENAQIPGEKLHAEESREPEANGQF